MKAQVAAESVVRLGSTLCGMTSPAEPAPTDNDSGPGGEPQPARSHTGSGPCVNSPRAQPDPARRSHTPPWADLPLRVGEPGEFIAAVPALLGFVPHRSLVACMLQEVPGRSDAVVLGAVARHDLDIPGCGAWLRVARQLAGLCAQEKAAGVLVLLVDDRAGPPCAGRPGARTARLRDLLRILDGALDAVGVEVAEAWAVREIADGAPWWSLLDLECTGAQLDPATSPIAVAHVLDGRPIRASREEMTDVVGTDPDLCAEVASDLERVTAAAADRYRQAVCRGEPGIYSRAALDLVLGKVTVLDSGGRAAARDLAEVAVALRDPAVRDAMFALALGEQVVPAEVLWSLLCRGLTGSDRAEAATLLGYSAYANGDGPFAGVALDAALDADPQHTVAVLLDTALRTGMPPREVRKLAVSGRAKAAALGVELPPDRRPES